MTIKSLLLVIAGLAVAGQSPATAIKRRTAACPSTTIFTPVLDHLDGYRVFTGPDGDSAVEPLRIDAKKVPMLNTGKSIALLPLPKPGTRAPSIVVGPGDVELPMHPAPYKEMFILLGGSFTFKTAKFSAAMTPGSVLLFEDVDAKIGHGGRIGPCGYVSLSIAP